jgi:uncharacterized repeat protein (TIGR03803 family)
MSKQIIVILLASSCIQGLSGGTPVFKIIFSEPANPPNAGYYSDVWAEVKSDVFYLMSTWQTVGNGPVLFSVSGAGAYQPIYTFPTNYSMGNFVQDVNGVLYGGQLRQSQPPPQGFYFSIDPSGKNLQGWALPGQWTPGIALIAAPSGDMYDLIGLYNIQGPPYFAFARVKQDRTVSILHRFSGSDGTPKVYPGFLALGVDGNFYGIGYQNATGTGPFFIYRFTPAGEYSKLLTFPVSNQGMIYYPLVAASDGNLYGTLERKGANNTGEVYQATLSGQYTVVASFPATGMKDSRTLNEAADGNLYGSTNLNQIFRYEVATQKLIQVYAMDPFGTQGRCPCPLMEGMDGKLYGSSGIGGPNGVGDVFSLDIGLPPPAPLVTGLYPSSGAVGTRVLLWGNYLLQTTGVSFNGVPAASYKETSKQSVQATVPTGATSGPVTLTTANGSLTTTQNFTVQ